MDRISGYGPINRFSFFLFAIPFFFWPSLVVTCPGRIFAISLFAISVFRYLTLQRVFRSTSVITIMSIKGSHLLFRELESYRAFPPFFFFCYGTCMLSRSLLIVAGCYPLPLFCLLGISICTPTPPHHQITMISS